MSSSHLGVAGAALDGIIRFADLHLPFVSGIPEIEDVTLDAQKNILLLRIGKRFMFFRFEFGYKLIKIPAQHAQGGKKAAPFSRCRSLFDFSLYDHLVVIDEFQGKLLLK